MREILFRGKRKDNGEMIFGNLNQHKTGKVFIKSGSAVHSFEVDHETVGQYTGLTDKNGKKIFEGDILQVCLDPEICVGMVVYDERIAAFEILYVNGFCNVFEDFFKARMQVGEKVWYEVIGNIHDNPELLKGGAENG